LDFDYTRCGFQYFLYFYTFKSIFAFVYVKASYRVNTPN